MVWLSMYMCVETRERYACPLSVTVYIIPLRRDLSWNPEPGWQPVKASNALVSITHNAKVTGAHDRD